MSRAVSADLLVALMSFYVTTRMPNLMVLTRVEMIVSSLKLTLEETEYLLQQYKEVSVHNQVLLDTWSTMDLFLLILNLLKVISRNQW